MEYRDKVKKICEDRVSFLLDKLPEYCEDYNNYLVATVSPKTRKEYFQDIYTFFRFISSSYKHLPVTRKNKGNPDYLNIFTLLSDCKTIPLEFLQMLNALDFDMYNQWLSKYKFSEVDDNEPEKENLSVTKKRKFASLRSFFKFLYSRDFISCNPCEKATMPVVKKKKRSDIRVLSSDEKTVFLNKFEEAILHYEEELNYLSSKSGLYRDNQLKLAIAKRDRAIVYLILGTGLRISELVAINIGNIVPDFHRINVIRKEDSYENKGTSDFVCLNSEVERLLNIYIDEARDIIGADDFNKDALFLSSRHCRITPRAVENMVKTYAELALGVGCGITPHKLRATFGTDYYAMTKDISATSSVMNHSSIEITASYYLKEDDKAREKVEGLKIKPDL